MGVFGTGIFADDDALDVRSDYKFFLADAQSDQLASDTIAREYGASLEDPSTTTSFWIALALTQWKIGRLEDRIKAVALRIIDEDLDLRKWDGSPDRRKRANALAEARRKIVSPQPAARPIPKPLPVQLPGWVFAEVVGVRLPNGKLALLHMICYESCSRYGVKAPVVSVLNWLGESIPTTDEILKLNFINWRGITRGNHLYVLATHKRAPFTEEKFLHLGLAKPVTRAEATSPYRSLSKDETLEDLLASVLEPYWRNPSLPPHHPGFDKPEAQLFKQPPKPLEEP